MSIAVSMLKDVAKTLKDVKEAYGDFNENGVLEFHFEAFGERFVTEFDGDGTSWTRKEGNEAEFQYDVSWEDTSFLECLKKFIREG